MYLKRGQISIEFILILSFALVLLVPTIYLFYNQSVASTTEIETRQIVSVGNAIIRDVEQIYTFGQGSFKTLQFRLPSRIENMSLVADNTTELVIYKDIVGLDHTMVFFSRYPMRIGSCKNQKPFST